MNEEHSIQDVQKQLPVLSDEDLQEVHDDIAEDVSRFMEHVGPAHGASFISAMLIEMANRKMPADDQFPSVPEKTEQLGAVISRALREGNHAKGGMATDPPTAKPMLNRKQRRSLRSKKKGTLRRR
jgi:hypothetical protein